MPTLTILVGFPGSGKSYEAKRRKAHNGALRIFDDPFKLNFFLHDVGFKAIVRALEAGTDCLISDVNFCHESNRAFFSKIMPKLITKLKITYEYFEANASNCRANIAGDFESSAMKAIDIKNRDDRLEALEATEGHYTVPANKKSLPVPNYYALPAPARPPGIL